MADPVVTEFIRDTGYAYWNPVSKSNLGTQLGFIADGIAVMPNYEITPITYETEGLTPQDYIFSGEEIIIQCKLTNITATVLQRAFLQSVSSVNVSLPGSLLTGTSFVGGSISGKFIFVPSISSHVCYYSTSCFASFSKSAPFKIHYRHITELDILFRCANIQIAPFATIFP